MTKSWHKMVCGSLYMNWPDEQRQMKHQQSSNLGKAFHNNKFPTSKRQSCRHHIFYCKAYHLEPTHSLSPKLKQTIETNFHMQPSKLATRGSIPLVPYIQSSLFHPSFHVDLRLQLEQLQNQLFSNFDFHLTTYFQFLHPDEQFSSNVDS